MCPRKIAVIIPTLNEADAIERLLTSIPTNVDGIEVSPLVIDGGSTNNTQKIVRAMRVPLFVQQESGKGAAMKEAVSLTDADILCFIDGDNTYVGADLVRIVRPILDGKADMVIGSRMLDECTRESGSITLFNLIGNRIFNWMTNFALKSKITDILSGYRAIRKSTFESLFLSTSGFEIEAEMTIEGLASELRVIEVPLTQYGRRVGTDTKLNPVGDGYRILKVLVLVLLSARPLLFFGIASAIFFAIGLYPASLVLYEKMTIGSIIHIPSVVFASLLWTMSAILLVIGVLAQIMVITRRRIERLLQARNGHKSHSVIR